MLKRKVFWVCVLVPMYAVTWIGGWISYAGQLREHTESAYRFIERDNQKEETQAHWQGYKPHPTQLRPDGPKSGVYWCIPMLPGVLLADSYESIGPLYGEGGVYVILYYGVGCTKLFMCGWRA
jgi:hypothetical protein